MLLSFIVIRYCMHGLWILNHPCLSRINPTWSQCAITSRYCCIWLANILLSIFAYVFIWKYQLFIFINRDWGMSFFLGNVLIWFWYQGNAGLIKWVWKYSFLFSFGREFEKDWNWLFFKYLLEFTSGSTWSWTLVWERFFDYWVYLLTSNQCVQTFYFFMI